MTTSEIAAAVQAGQADRLELWEAVRRFAHDRAYRWCRAMDGRAGMVLEDYIQVAFLALLDALEGWDPAASEEIAGIAERDFQDQRRMAVRRAIDSLQEQQRQAVVLRYCYGLSLDQTAARMGTTRATAMTAEQKGLRLLRHPKNRELRQYA